MKRNIAWELKAFHLTLVKTGNFFSLDVFPAFPTRSARASQRFGTDRTARTL
jgi:hypothetical protein